MTMHKRMLPGSHLLQGKRHGAGKQTWPDKRTYDGQWEANLRHGQEVKPEGSSPPSAAVTAACTGPKVDLSCVKGCGVQDGSTCSSGYLVSLAFHLNVRPAGRSAITTSCHLEGQVPSASQTFRRSARRCFMA